jgi:hypothetical protein
MASLIAKDLGFNCVRFTMSNEMLWQWNQPISARMETFMSVESQQLLYSNNPQWRQPNTSVGDVVNATMQALLDKNILIILDNHVSKASW